MSMHEIERRISRELQTITAQLWHHEGPAALEHTHGDFFDAAQAVEHREGQQLSAGRLADRARRLADALERIRVGTYGVCRVCGERIPLARLKAIPDADTCLRCQTSIEHDEHLTAD